MSHLRARSRGLVPALLAAAGVVLASSVLLLAEIDLGGRAVSSQLDLPYEPLAKTGEDGEEEAPETVVFFGGTYETNGVFFCLDRSLSMGGAEGWSALQRELERAITELGKGADFGLVFFGEKIAMFPANGRPAAASDETKRLAIATLKSLAPESWTCMRPGLREALHMAHASRKKHRALILMSDGKPTCRGVNYFDYLEEILGEAKLQNRDRVKIHSVATGQDVNEPFLRQLASEHGGTYKRVH
jgi:hypothetical protein